MKIETNEAIESQPSTNKKFKNAQLHRRFFRSPCLSVHQQS